jgi:hypothetical protein
VLEVVADELVSAVRATCVRGTPQTAGLGNFSQHQNGANQWPIHAHVTAAAGHYASLDRLTSMTPTITKSKRHLRRPRAHGPVQTRVLNQRLPGCTMTAEVMPMRKPLRTS